jgi:hypothetical protein
LRMTIAQNGMRDEFAVQIVSVKAAPLRVKTGPILGVRRRGYVGYLSAVPKWNMLPETGLFTPSGPQKQENA